MRRKTIALVGASAFAAMLAGLGTVGHWRVRDAAELSRPRPVTLADGTRLELRVTEVTAGRTAGGYTVMVFTEMSNPNPAPVTLERNAFALWDGRRRHAPAPLATQGGLIRLAPNAVQQPQVLSFAVEESSLAGALQLVGTGPVTMPEVLLKAGGAPRRPLAEEEFRSYRRTRW
jgi:hypothetical protein